MIIRISTIQLGIIEMLTPVTFFKALADDTRLRCLMLIAQQGELCVCELMAALDESQPKVSRHLAQLRKTGLLQDRRQGQWVFYQLSPLLPEWAVTTLQQTTMQNKTFIASNSKQLLTMGDRPERVKSCC